MGEHLDRLVVAAEMNVNRPQVAANVGRRARNRTSRRRAAALGGFHALLVVLQGRLVVAQVVVPDWGRPMSR